MWKLPGGEVRKKSFQNLSKFEEKRGLQSGGGCQCKKCGKFPEGHSKIDWKSRGQLKNIYVSSTWLRVDHIALGNTTVYQTTTRS